MNDDSGGGSDGENGCKKNEGEPSQHSVDDTLPFDGCIDTEFYYVVLREYNDVNKNRIQTEVHSEYSVFLFHSLSMSMKLSFATSCCCC